MKTPKKKIVIFGATGLLGNALTEFLKKSEEFSPVSLSKEETDITDREQVLETLLKHKPFAVINCAALINVEYCEANPLEAWKVNGFGPGVIANSLRKADFSKTIFIHISTSDVFGNEKMSYVEKDPPNPVNVYGMSKLGGEKIATGESKAAGIKCFVLRTSWLYGYYRKTFVDIVALALKEKKEFSVIKDQFSVPSYAGDVAEAIVKLIKTSSKYEPGVYHVLNNGDKGMSKYKIAVEIANILKLDKKYLKKAPKVSILKVPRPKSATLLNTKMAKLPDWKKSLREYLLARYS